MSRDPWLPSTHAWVRKHRMPIKLFPNRTIQVITPNGTNILDVLKDPECKDDIVLRRGRYLYRLEREEVTMDEPAPTLQALTPTVAYSALKLVLDSEVAALATTWEETLATLGVDARLYTSLECDFGSEAAYDTYTLDLQISADMFHISPNHSFPKIPSRSQMNEVVQPILKALADDLTKTILLNRALDAGFRRANLQPTRITHGLDLSYTVDTDQITCPRGELPRVLSNSRTPGPHHKILQEIVSQALKATGNPLDATNDETTQEIAPCTTMSTTLELV